MELNQRNLTYLAFRGELIGTTIHTDKGAFKILQLMDYDSMTQCFTLEVQNPETLITTIQEFSDKYRYGIEQTSRREYPNDKILKPSRW